MIKEISESIFELENKYNLFDKSVNKVYYWKLLRFGVNEKIVESKCNFGRRHSQGNLLMLLMNSLKLEWLNWKDYLTKETCDILIIQHPRKVLVDNQKIDIYTYHLEKELIQSGYKVKVLQTIGLGQSFTEISKDSVKVLKISTLIKMFFRKYMIKINDSDLNEVEVILNQKYDVNLNLESSAKLKISLFESQYQYYKQLFKRLEPKEVYLVVSYGYEALIAAANDLGIIVTEMQHGVISRYHFGYSFPGQESIPYFPNRIYLFGEYWRDSTPIPLSSNELVVYGNKHLRNIMKNNQSIKRQEQTLLVISQGSIGRQLVNYTVNLLSEYPELNIIYKLHPGEFNRWKTDYPELVDCQSNNRLMVIEAGVSLYDLFRKCEYVLGVYSTAIYEALAFECQVALLKLDGVEHMEFLIENKLVTVVDKVEDLQQLFLTNSVNKVSYTYYF